MFKKTHIAVLLNTRRFHLGTLTSLITGHCIQINSNNIRNYFNCKDVSLFFNNGNFPQKYEITSQEYNLFS